MAIQTQKFNFQPSNQEYSNITSYRYEPYEIRNMVIKKTGDNLSICTRPQHKNFGGTASVLAGTTNRPTFMMTFGDKVYFNCGTNFYTTNVLTNTAPTSKGSISACDSTAFLKVISWMFRGRVIISLKQEVAINIYLGSQMVEMLQNLILELEELLLEESHFLMDTYYLILMVMKNYTIQM